MSDYIRAHGRWADCDQLLQFQGGLKGLTVDVGGNIGSCTLLLLAAGARVIAFEPVALNLYYLTRSVLAQPPEWRQRLTLYAVALGSEAGEHVIYMENGNAGNSVIDKPIGAVGGLSFNITVRRLDDMLWPDPSAPIPHIGVLKLDAQGYEVKVLAGAPRLLAARAIRCIKTEMARDWLVGQGTSPSAFCQVLWAAGFVLSHSGLVVNETRCRSWDAPGVLLDISGCLR